MALTLLFGTFNSPDGIDTSFFILYQDQKIITLKFPTAILTLLTLVFFKLGMPLYAEPRSPGRLKVGTISESMRNIVSVRSQ
jgi:hypothetical protein